METSTPASPVNAVLSTVLRPEILRIAALVLGVLAVLFLGLITAGTHAGAQEARSSFGMGWGQADLAAAIFGVVTRVWILSTLTCAAGVVLAFVRRLPAAGACFLGSAFGAHWLLGGFMRAGEGGDLLWLLLPVYLAGAAACGAYYLSLHPYVANLAEPEV
ncbi:MAG: hypothetical protein EA417_15625 [Gammaproteobacteria bacterium]|nr:MAG: hypothetical protein EA417_15625 [Gammaproteobacteria bacterium]